MRSCSHGSLGGLSPLQFLRKFPGDKSIINKMKLPENLTLEVDKRIWVGHIHHRAKRSTGCLSRDAMLCMMF